MKLQFENMDRCHSVRANNIWRACVDKVKGCVSQDLMVKVSKVVIEPNTVMTINRLVSTNLS